MAAEVCAIIAVSCCIILGSKWIVEMIKDANRWENIDDE